MKLKFYTPLLDTAREGVARQFLPANPPIRRLKGKREVVLKETRRLRGGRIGGIYFQRSRREFSNRGSFAKT
jgi:hypothetical protein